MALEWLLAKVGRRLSETPALNGLGVFIDVEDRPPSLPLEGNDFAAWRHSPLASRQSYPGAVPWGGGALVAVPDSLCDVALRNNVSAELDRARWRKVGGGSGGGGDNDGVGDERGDGFFSLDDFVDPTTALPWEQGQGGGVVPVGAVVAGLAREVGGTGGVAAGAGGGAEGRGGLEAPVGDDTSGVDDGSNSGGVFGGGGKSSLESGDCESLCASSAAAAAAAAAAETASTIAPAAPQLLRRQDSQEPCYRVMVFGDSGEWGYEQDTMFEVKDSRGGSGGGSAGDTAGSGGGSGSSGSRAGGPGKVRKEEDVIQVIFRREGRGVWEGGVCSSDGTGTDRHVNVDAACCGFCCLRS